ncbi:MAG: (2Fe-2S)-binding protein [Spirochaetes bacterium GWD1_61_31]|nr:MAG: (2Fe-2S)-binding protein [Spirochaetes bacterium GWB1_60_80]OHD35164.1 MAG: (2Fe-2S)-binding protein [Spirochaetes bacterium GWC1_61_12]OHD43081.1 MAG: (2Fe-2S)-binding protein [Spirochaetes bacterium GWE1_60_18]OHD43521.1 MAG: (2Fe-2S)-binding protein [Spirochaetes bacterium GWD1_61_31]OHD59676.1 MAG: (2Fe-2S)-binding protein [Spirochaetes bacterium GWF1_60_12]HAP44094.1 (2Fe-2S)-binding protein [Spirochaetaceae bacterium]
MRISLTVNGQRYTVDVAEHKTLLRCLREDLGLTGTKEGCGMGECGACTIIFNGRVVNACMILAVEANGATIETIEGEATGPGLSEIQTALERNNSAQCGFCTPGMVMSIKELLRDKPKPTIDEMKEAIEGNFCRCTGYVQIIEAILDLTGRSAEKGELKHV